ncbi:MAG: tetratricopeptide repeat protein [Actinomycetota bacterium]|nr:tetratricopeptide repeat protein [Actinomycetota bacterium]
MPETAVTPAQRTTIGTRIRNLRVARGLTQSELAGTRFSKQYVSEIERGTTRPTAQTLAWLAERLGVDRHFLESGLTSKEYDRAEAIVARGEAAVDAHEYREAIEILGASAESPSAAPELEVRALRAEAWARMYLGELDAALTCLQRARKIVETPSFTDVDRADILFRLGCCRYKLSSTATALSLFDEALGLAERSGLPCDRLRSQIFGWRSRCYRRQRDWVAASEDVERALELAQSLKDLRAMADAHFLGSLIAERQGRWVLARSYAERAKALYEQIHDRADTGKLLTTLGALNFLLGRPAEAVTFLKEAVGAALDVGSQADAAQAISSLAQVHLRTGELALAEEHARHALSLLQGRVDFVDEIGNTELVLGRALLEQGRLDEAEGAFVAAEKSFDQLGSASHRAAAWAAQADLAVAQGDRERAIHLYQAAVNGLQDFHF